MNTLPCEVASLVWLANHAVLYMAQQLYSQQDIRKANCVKTGFNASGDLLSCDLTLADGTTTDDSSWGFAKTGGHEWAQPAS